MYTLKKPKPHSIIHTVSAANDSFRQPPCSITTILLILLSCLKINALISKCYLYAKSVGPVNAGLDFHMESQKEKGAAESAFYAPCLMLYRSWLCLENILEW